MANDHDISVLNSLIETTLDSRKGFMDAAGDAHSTRFVEDFNDFARERGEAAALLQAEVRRLGGEPEDGASMLGAAHRAFMNLRELFSTRDDKAIIAEVERGEDYIKNKYEAALADSALSGSTVMVIRQAYTSVQAGHARARALQHGLT
jgi:uncharacterized protein (TIGR02284 family)